MGYFTFPLALTEDWVPEKLIVRDDKMRRMLNVLETPGLRHMYVFGPRGVGKTLTCRVLLSHYPDGVYIKCGTSLRESVRYTLLSMGVKVGRSMRVEEALASATSIVVFDDVNMIHNYKSLEFLHSLYEFNRDDRLAVILVSNTWSFQLFKEEVCPPSVFSRYNFTPISFGPYTAAELYDILKQRAERTFKSYEEGALRFIAAKAARFGDARIGLRMLKYAWAASKTLTLKQVEEAWHIEKKRYWREEVLSSLDGHTALLLWLTAKLAERSPEGKVMSSELNQQYKMFCSSLGVEPLYEAALNHYLRKLEAAGYISRKPIHLGRHGLQSEITLLFDDPAIIEEAGGEVDWASTLF